MAGRYIPSSSQPRFQGVLMKHLRNILIAISLLLVSSWAPGPSQVFENTPESSDDSIQHQTGGSGSGTTLVFPDYVDGGGWSVQLALTNLARSAAAEVVITAHDPEGRPVELFEAETEGEIPPLGSRVYRSTGGGAVRRGWIEVRTDPPSVSGLLTYRHSGSGMEVGVAPVESGDRFALFVEESDEVGSGLAIFKPARESQIELGIRDEAGQDPVGEVLLRGEFQQAARTLPEWFQGVDTGFLRNFRGLLLLGTEDGPPFAPLGLRFGKGTGSLSAVPVIPAAPIPGDGPPNPLQSPGGVSDALIFPDYVDGSGWSVQLTLSNVNEMAAASGEVLAHDQEGRRIELFDSDARFEIPPLGSRVYRSAGEGGLRRGWIEVRTGGAAVSGLLTYRHSDSGVEVGVAPVELWNQFALFVEESSEVGAGLAVFKPEASSRIELRVRDEAGRDPLGDVFVPWRDFRQSARTISEWLDVDGVETGFLENFRGLLFLRSQDGFRFAPLGLRFGKGTVSLSAVPVVRIVDGVRIDAGVGAEGGVEIEGGVGTGGGGKAPPPTVTLSVAPSSIDRGQSATLRWSSTNADSVEITPDVGNVSTSGTQKVSPRTTTTYRITVRAADGQTATATVRVTVTVSDRAVLEALYEATGGANWIESTNWLTDAPFGDWRGVEVDDEGRIVSLNLAANNLTGSIPPELGGLVNLRHLDFQSNQLEGAIPPALGNLVDLRHLDLGANRLAGPISAELGNLANLTSLWLGGNRLTGPVPPALGNLANLEWLDVRSNELTGPIPQSFLQLDRLRGFFIEGIENLCVPGTASFVAWLQGIEDQDLSENLCNAADVTALNSLFDAAGGSGWTASDGWAGDGAVEEWYGVSADSLGHVTELDLTRNGLVGRLPATLGDLTQMTTLRIGANPLSGRLPLSLSQVPLREFHYADTDLCVPTKESFRAWLNAIPSHGGTGVECAPVIPTHLSVDPPSLAPAEAGKQGRDTIYVTVTDAEGIPVADVGYRWTTDRNSGWVFPAEGKTSAQGLISATWVAGSPGNGILVATVGEGASTLTVELETQSVAPAHPPWGQSTVWLDNSPRGTGYSIELTPLTEPHQSYYAAINWDGAYTGLQRGGYFERSLIFCMFDPPGGRTTRIIRHAEDAFCTSFDHQGTGMECHLNYPWQVGTGYRFEVTEQEMDGGSAMTVHVTNLVTGERRFVATMLYGARPDLTSFASFVEDFRRTAPTCLDQEVRSAAIRRAMVRINGVWESITRGYFAREDDYGNPGTGPCLNAAARDHPLGLEIAIGGRTAMDPNISKVTIPR